MKKLILVDGNNLMFRSYYATAYTGNFMKNSKGFPTNALFGFTNMINKIVLEEKPEYMIVAFDIGKTFRHDKYKEYKGGRGETPDELKMQFPIAKKLLTAMGIKYYEIENYEADDIIGTFAKFCDDNDEFIGTIVSSDKDLLQLISNDVDIKLLKQKDYIRYNLKSFVEEFGINPINVIDLKAIQGDSSDNIPGVKGIGEKGALKLLQDYKTLAGVYENLDKLSPKIREKLENDKENAYLSYELATIEKEVPVTICIDDLKYLGNKHESLNLLYEDLEFFSFLKKMNTNNDNAVKNNEVNNKIEVSIETDNIKLNMPSAFYLETNGKNYHDAKVLGMSVYNDEISIYVTFDKLEKFLKNNFKNLKYTFDLKKQYVIFKKLGYMIPNATFDTMLATSLLDYNVKDDIAYLSNQNNMEIPFYETIYGKVGRENEITDKEIASYSILKSKFIYESKEKFINELEKEEMLSLFNDIEVPLAETLAEMEITGVKVDSNTLEKMGEEIKENIDEISFKIHELAGEVFLISSPKELGRILFEKLELPHGKKNSNGYSTAVDVLNKLENTHPIIPLIMEYRTMTKLYSTYIEGLKVCIKDDSRIHTIYTQTLTRTGRLSSIEPNLQNIPTRNEYGKLIRKAFVASEDSVLVSADYSQIELRIFSHMADIKTLKEAFNLEQDIHTRTASDVFHIPLKQVTSNQRRVAKAVNFGILYGISSFGLSENLQIPVYEAKEFIDKYFVTYPGVKDFMNKLIEDAKEKGYVTTLLKRKRIIPELNNKNYMIRSQGERMALNTPIQGTSADIIKKAMVEINDYMKEKEMQSKLIMQVHDELIIDCKKNEYDLVCKMLEDIMEGTYPISVPLKVDINSGETWYDAK